MYNSTTPPLSLVSISMGLLYVYKLYHQCFSVEYGFFLYIGDSSLNTMVMQIWKWEDWLLSNEKKSPHFATPQLVCPRNDVWETNEEIPYWWRVTNSGGYSTNVYTGWLRPEVQPLTLLYIIFHENRTPFVYLLLTNSTPFTYLV